MMMSIVVAMSTDQSVVVQDNFAHPDVEWGPVTNDPRCGVSAIRRSVAQRRIVGGDEAGFGTFPWQAYIRIGTSRSAERYQL